MAKKPPLPQIKPTKPPLPGSVKYAQPWLTGVPGPVALESKEEPQAEAFDFGHLSERTRTLRQLFVVEYVKDFHAGRALQRLGFAYARPNEAGARWLSEPYTQYVLDKYIQQAKEEALVTRGEVIAILKREAYSSELDSSGAARVSAAKQLARILGMQIDRAEVNVAVSGGIMLVPLAESTDAWEKNAATAQAKLKADAIDV